MDLPQSRHARVPDLARASYQRLGWRGQQVEETVFFQAGGMALVLWGRDKLAADGGAGARERRLRSA